MDYRCYNWAVNYWNRRLDCQLPRSRTALKAGRRSLRLTVFAPHCRQDDCNKLIDPAECRTRSLNCHFSQLYEPLTPWRSAYTFSLMMAAAVVIWLCLIIRSTDVPITADCTTELLLWRLNGCWHQFRISLQNITTCLQIKSYIPANNLESSSV